MQKRSAELPKEWEQQYGISPEKKIKKWQKLDTSV
jgi:hypothetical protein